MKLYVDLDGVLADFDSSAEGKLGTDNIYKYEFVWGAEKFWTEMNKDETFFRYLSLKDDALKLWNNIEQFDPVILTALPKSGADRVEKQKRAWAGEHFPGTEVITCLTKDKPKYCKLGDILIDDRAVNLDAWKKAGGIYIVHTTADRTISTLQALGVIN